MALDTDGTHIVPGAAPVCPDASRITTYYVHNRVLWNKFAGGLEEWVVANEAHIALKHAPRARASASSSASASAGSDEPGVRRPRPQPRARHANKENERAVKEAKRAVQKAVVTAKNAAKRAEFHAGQAEWAYAWFANAAEEKAAVAEARKAAKEKAAVAEANRSAIPDKGKSRFVGVSWDKREKKWYVRVTVKGKRKRIGYYDDETAAARAFDAYVIANKINANLNFPSAAGATGHRTTKKGRTSSYRGVYWDKWAKKWVARITVDGKKKRLGSFVDEDDAGRACNKYRRNLHVSS
jgi:hypothetical protein